MEAFVPHRLTREQVIPTEPPPAANEPTPVRAMRGNPKIKNATPAPKARDSTRPRITKKGSGFAGGSNPSGVGYSTRLDPKARTVPTPVTATL